MAQSLPVSVSVLNARGAMRLRNQSSEALSIIRRAMCWVLIVHFTKIKLKPKQEKHGMLFLEALEQLKKGEYVRRSSWKIEEGFLVFMPGMEFAWKIIGMPSPNAGNYIWCMADFAAEDWVVVDELDFKVKPAAAE